MPSVAELLVWAETACMADYSGFQSALTALRECKGSAEAEAIEVAEAQASTEVAEAEAARVAEETQSAEEEAAVAAVAAAEEQRIIEEADTTRLAEANAAAKASEARIATEEKAAVEAEEDCSGFDDAADGGVPASPGGGDVVPAVQVAAPPPKSTGVMLKGAVIARRESKSDLRARRKSLNVANEADMQLSLQARLDEIKQETEVAEAARKVAFRTRIEFDRTAKVKRAEEDRIAAEAAAVEAARQQAEEDQAAAEAAAASVALKKAERKAAADKLAAAASERKLAEEEAEAEIWNQKVNRVAEFCTISKEAIAAGASASHAALDAALTQLSSLEQMVEEHQDQKQSLTEATQEITGLGEEHQGTANGRATELASTLTEITAQIEELQSTVEAKKSRLEFIDDFTASADDYIQQVEMIKAGLAKAEKLAKSGLPSLKAKTGNERHFTSRIDRLCSQSCERAFSAMSDVISSCRKGLHPPPPHTHTLSPGAQQHVRIQENGSPNDQRVKTRSHTKRL